MASTHRANQALVNTYHSCGRCFAAVDPERLREVEFSSRAPAKSATAPARPRGATTEWFSPPRAPSPQGGTRSGR